MYAEFRKRHVALGDHAWQRISPRRFATIEAAKSCCRRHFNQSMSNTMTDYRIISSVRGAAVSIALGRHGDRLHWKNL